MTIEERAEAIVQLAISETLGAAALDPNCNVCTTYSQARWEAIRLFRHGFRYSALCRAIAQVEERWCGPD